MGSALRRLEQDHTDLLRRYSILRQEESIEEIEMLMLSILITRRRRECHGKERRSTMAIDPVCHMEVDERSAAGQSAYQGTTYYFCSPGCREAFEKNPGRYLPKTTGLLGQKTQSDR